MQKLLILFVLFCFYSYSYAQKLSDIVFEKEALVLKAMGSFYVGGESEQQSRSEIGGFFPSGHLTVNQMYVNFMVPQKRKDSTSFVLIHGMTLSGKTYETTPDGRMGWNEYLVRKGYPVYVVDQVSIGRSGFNQKSYNKVRSGETEPALQPAIIRTSDENTLVNFRFTTPDNEPVHAAKFPMKALKELSKQSLPFMAGTVPKPDPNFHNLSLLAADLKQAVLVSHSQSGAFPLQAALLNRGGIKAIVMVEPGGTGSGFTDEQIKMLSKTPVLIVFGDNLEIPTGVTNHSWKASFDGWSNIITRLKAAGGTAQMMNLPDLGIKGNSHVPMMDTNNQQIADLILEWLVALTK